MKKTLRSYLFYIFIFAIFLILALIPYYLNRTIILGGEGNFFIDFTKHLANNGFTWLNISTGVPTTSLNVNVPNIYILSFIQNLFGIRIANFTLIFSIYFLPFIAVFLICKKFKLSAPLTFMISLFYLLNPFTLYYLTCINQWNAMCLAAIPFFFWIILEYYHNNLMLFFCFGLISFSFAFANANPPIMILIQISLIITVFIISNYFTHKFVPFQFIRKYFIVLASFIVHNLWWIIHWIISLRATKEIYSPEFAGDWLRIIIQNTKQITFGVLTFSHLISKDTSYDFFALLYNQNLACFILLIPIFLIVHHVFLCNNNRQNKLLLLLFTLWIISVSFTKGTSLPFGYLYHILYKYLPFFNIFKTPTEKFGILNIFLFVLLLIFSIKGPSKSRYYRWQLGFLTLYLFFCLIPLISGNIIPSYKHNRKITVTRKYIDKQEYKDFRKEINNDNTDYKILSLPGSKNYQVCMTNYNGLNYTGMDPVLYNTKKAFIDASSGPFMLYNNFSNINYDKLLGMYNIKKIVINKDIIPWFGFRENKKLPELKRIFSRTKKQKKYGAITVYDNSYFLPHIYPAANPVFVTGDENTLLLLPKEYFLKTNPLFVFSSQILNSQILRKINAFILKDFRRKDTGIYLARRYPINNGNFLLELKKDGIYEIWADTSIEISSEFLFPTDITVKIDKIPSGHNILQPNIMESKIFNKAQKNYQKICEKYLKKGRHLFEINRFEDYPAVKFFLVDKEERVGWEKSLWQSIHESGSVIYYNFTKNRYFYIPTDSSYILEAEIIPNFVKQKKEQIEIDFYRKEELDNWTFRPENISFNYGIIGFNELLVLTNFDGDKHEDEYLQMRNKNLRVDLTTHPYLDLTYKIVDPNVQTIEIVAGIDFDKDEIVDGHIRGLYPNPASAFWTKYSYNIYAKAVKIFPNKKNYDLIFLEIYPHKLWGVDTSTYSKRGLYTFWLKNLKFYNYSEINYVRNLDCALDLKMNSETNKIIKRQIDSEETYYFIKYESEDLASLYSEKKQFLEIGISTEGIDLQKYPKINLSYINLNTGDTNIKFILDIDTDADLKIDKSFSSNFFSIKRGRANLNINGYDMLKEKLSGEGTYNLMGIRFVLDKWHAFSGDNLKIYSESLIPIDNLRTGFPVMKIDNMAYKFKPGDKQIKNPNRIYFKQELKLDRGVHYLELDNNESFHVKNIFLSPAIQKTNYSAIKQNEKQMPEIAFEKVSPAYYKVKIKQAAQPFWLVFSENFNRQWKVYLEQRIEENTVSRTDKIAAVYLKIKVLEYMHVHNHSFKKIKYLFKQPLDVDHLVANGYANGWYIDTKKLNLPEEFSLTILFWPEIIFWLTGWISSLIILTSIISSAVILVRKK